VGKTCVGEKVAGKRCLGRGCLGKGAWEEVPGKRSIREKGDIDPGTRPLWKKGDSLEKGTSTTDIHHGKVTTMEKVTSTIARLALENL